MRWLHFRKGRTCLRFEKWNHRRKKWRGTKKKVEECQSSQSMCCDNRNASDYYLTVEGSKVIPARPARLPLSDLALSPTDFSSPERYWIFLCLLNIFFLHSSLKESQSKLTKGEVGTFVSWTSHNYIQCFGRKSPDNSCSLEY